MKIKLSKMLNLFLVLLVAILSSLFSLAEEKPKPKVLIIGDSISLGYTPYVIESLKDLADVEHNPGNAGATKGGVQNIDSWLGDKKWDVIHFNWGLWDINRRVNGKRDVNGPIACSPEAYEEQLSKIVKRMKETGATLIWGSTTYVQGGWGRVKGDEIKYNQIAEKIMKDNDVQIDDLHALTAQFAQELFKSKGNVHFTEEGYKKISEQVASSIKDAISKRSEKNK